MARMYEASISRASGTGPIAVASITTGTRRASIVEIGIFNTLATAGELGLGRATGTGVTPTSALVQAMDPADEAGTSNLTTWASGIAAPSVFMRRIMLPATIGAGVIWTWAPGEFMIPASVTTAGAPVIWQISATTVTWDIYVKVLE